MKIQVFSLLLAAAALAPAGTVTLDAVSSGFYVSDGAAVGGNYTIGYNPNSGEEVRNFFVFNLSTVSGTVTSAKLRVSARGPSSAGYVGDQPSETFALFDVTTSPTTLAALTGGVAAFNDLGTGTGYGSLVILNPGNVQPIVTHDVTLNAAGLAAIQANLGASQFAVGGAISSLDKGAAFEMMFNGTSASLTRQLIIETSDLTTAVPEPGTLLLAAAGLAGVVIRRRR